MTPDRRTMLFINIGHFIDHYVVLIFPTAVLGMIAAGGGQAFGLGYGDLVTLATGMLVAFGVFALPAGWLADRWSRRTMMIVFFLGTGASLVLCALVWNAWTLAIALTLVGVFASIYHPVGTALLVSTTDRLGRDIGRNGVCGNLGVAFAALVTGVIMDVAGWRATFLVPAVITLGIGFLYLASPQAAAGQAATSRVPRFTVDRRAAILGFVLLTTAGAMSSIIFNAVTIALPKLLDERVPLLTGWGTGIGIVAAAIVTVGALAQIVVGRLIDRYSIFHIAVLTAAFATPFLALAISATGPLVVICMAGVMVTLFGQVTVNESMLACYVPDSWRGRAYAVRFAVSFGVATLATVLVGQLHDHAGGFGPVMLVLAVLGAVVFLCAVLLPRPATERRPGLATAPPPVPAE